MRIRTCNFPLEAVTKDALWLSSEPNILKPELQSILTSATGLDPNELYRLQVACHASLSRMPVSR